MMRLKALILGLFLSLMSFSAWAQTGCQGQPSAGLTCGNPNATAGLPSWATMTALLDRNFGGPSVQGTVLNRGASAWASTATPVLGLNGGTGGSLTLNGATSGSALIGVNAVAGSTTFKFPVGNGTNGFVLSTDGSGNTSWANPASGGTVTSVGLALPASILTVTGSPVTVTGTLTGSLATQSANLVWAGPTTGAATTPTFRSLVGADLPNPSASTLGGVQSFAAVGSQWIRQISTSGVPTASQPAFTDISGVAAAAQLPNPTASTLGGIESLAAVASKWINTISTSGVPSATQPVFSDISGNATLGQLPSIANGSIISNISGGSSTPLGNSLTSIIDSVVGSTQGQVLYRSGTVWTALNPGTAGQVLSTNGAAANPSWTTVSGTGTVTSVATNNGVTGGTITTSGTIGLASISTGNVLANVSGISAAPSANTPTSVLDVIGSTQGSILYRGASVWTALTPGTSGQFLQTTGAGSTPQWASAAAISGSPTAGQLAQWTNSSTIKGVTFSVVTQVFTSTGTYTPTTGMAYAIGECYGSGGGGGGVALSSSQGQGGGGGTGSYSRKTMTAAAVGASQAITIGAAGTGGAAGNNNGVNGGDVSIGSLCIGKGGTGGQGAPANSGSNGGAGGVAGTGDVTGTGTAGGGGIGSATTSIAIFTPAGGSSPLGGGGVSGSGTTVFTGTTATGFASGGGGANSFNGSAAAAGGPGTKGIVIITEYVIN